MRPRQKARDGGREEAATISAAACLASLREAIKTLAPFHENYSNEMKKEGKRRGEDVSRSERECWRGHVAGRRGAFGRAARRREIS